MLLCKHPYGEKQLTALLFFIISHSSETRPFPLLWKLIEVSYKRVHPNLWMSFNWELAFHSGQEITFLDFCGLLAKAPEISETNVPLDLSHCSLVPLWAAQLHEHVFIFYFYLLFGFSSFWPKVMSCPYKALLPRVPKLHINTSSKLLTSLNTTPVFPAFIHSLETFFLIFFSKWTFKF